MLISGLRHTQFRFLRLSTSNLAVSVSVREVNAMCDMRNKKKNSKNAFPKPETPHRPQTPRDGAAPA